MISLLALSFIIVMAFLLARAWIGFLLVYFAVMLTVLMHTDNNALLAVLAATAASMGVLFLGRWLNRRWPSDD